MAEFIRIDLFTDVVCPWCLIGTARLDQALAELDPAVRVDIAHHPFLLAPDLPDEGRNTVEWLASKYGHDVAPMQRRVEQAAHAAGVELDLAVQPMSYPTVKAHTLIRSAPLENQYALAKAFAAAYFFDGRNIADHNVLADVAAVHGFSRKQTFSLIEDPEELDTTRELAQSAGQYGVSGVPFFIFDNRFAFSGAQPPEMFARALRLALGGEHTERP